MEDETNGKNINITDEETICYVYIKTMGAVISKRFRI